jgi:hypothetical protein
MEEQTQQKDKINGERLLLSISFFVVPIIVLLIFWYLDILNKIFYVTEKNDISSLYGLLWCGFGSMWGFSTIAFYWRKVPKTPTFSRIFDELHISSVSYFIGCFIHSAPIRENEYVPFLLLFLWPMFIVRLSS